MAIPYVRRARDTSAYDRRYADMIRMQGAQQADAIRENGNIQAQMWSNLGNTIASTVMGVAQVKQQDAAQAEQKRQAGVSQQIREALKLTRDPETGKLDLNAAAREVTTIDPIEGLKWWAMASDEEKQQTAQGLATIQGAAKTAAAFLSIPEQRRPSMWPQTRQAFAERHQVPIETIPEVWDPNTELWLRDTLYKALPVAEAIEQMGKAAKGISEGTYRVFVNDGGKKVEKLVTAEDLMRGIEVWTEPKEDKPPTSFEAAILAARAAGDTAEVNKLLADQARFEGNQRTPKDPKDPAPALTKKDRNEIDRWKLTELNKAEADFAQATKQFVEDGIQIPPHLITAHEQRKAAIQATYQSQLGVPAGQPAAMPNPPAPPGAPPPARAQAPTGAPIGSGTANAAQNVPNEVVQFLQNQPGGKVYTLLDPGGNEVRFLKHADGRVERVP
jgi:hypothetical protein